MSTITIPSGIGEVSAEVAASLKAKGDPDAKLANAVVSLATQARVDVLALEAAGGGDTLPPIVYRLATGVKSQAKVAVAIITSPVTVTKAFLAAEEAFAPADVAWSSVTFWLHDADESSPRAILRKDTTTTAGNGLLEVTTAFFEGGANPQTLGNAATYENLVTPFAITPDANTPSVISIEFAIGASTGAFLPKGLYGLVIEPA